MVNWFILVINMVIKLNYKMTQLLNFHFIGTDSDDDTAWNDFQAVYWNGIELIEVVLSFYQNNPSEIEILSKLKTTIT